MSTVYRNGLLTGQAQASRSPSAPSPNTACVLNGNSLASVYSELAASYRTTDKQKYLQYINLAAYETNRLLLEKIGIVNNPVIVSETLQDYYGDESESFKCPEDILEGLHGLAKSNNLPPI